MATGIVKWFDPRRGYGFIVDDQGRDVLAHYSSIEGDGFRVLEKGDTVEYDLQQGPRGLFAVRIRRGCGKFDDQPQTVNGTIATPAATGRAGRSSKRRQRELAPADAARRSD